MVGINGECKFPFTYGNIVYETCTTMNSTNNVPWCLTTKGNGDWTACKSIRFHDGKSLDKIKSKYIFNPILYGAWLLHEKV